MKFLISLVLVFIFTSLAFAEIPIYCPCDKKLVYYYKKDEIIPGTPIKAEDFRPASEDIPQPKESDPMVCPHSKCPLNLYESWAYKRGMKPPVFHVWAISFLTKDKDENFVGVPYDIKVEDWEKKH